MYSQLIGYSYVYQLSQSFPTTWETQVHFQYIKFLKTYKKINLLPVNKNTSCQSGVLSQIPLQTVIPLTSVTENTPINLSPLVQ